LNLFYAYSREERRLSEDDIIALLREIPQGVLTHPAMCGDIVGKILRMIAAPQGRPPIARARHVLARAIKLAPHGDGPIIDAFPAGQKSGQKSRQKTRFPSNICRSAPS
jgi:hypothetical protein